MKKYSHLDLSVSKERANYLRHASVSVRKKPVIGNPEWILIIQYTGKFTSLCR